MAGRHEGCGAIGCAGICFLFVVAMCTAGSGGRSGDDHPGPSPDTAITSAPAEPREWPAAPEPVPESPADSGTQRSDGERQLHVGPRGGCYYINRNGNKTYVDRSACAGSGASAPEPTITNGSGSSGGVRPGGGRQLHVGPRGGCYYINSNGNKTYVDRSECY